MWDDGKSSELISLLKAVRYSISRDGKAFNKGDTSIIGAIDEVSLTDGVDDPRSTVSVLSCYDRVYCVNCRILSQSLR